MYGCLRLRGEIRGVPMRLDVADVARLLRVSQNQVYHWINRDQLPAIKVKGKYCFNLAKVFEWATIRKVDVCPETFSEQFGLSKQVSLAAALRRGGVAYNLQSREQRVGIAGGGRGAEPAAGSLIGSRCCSCSWPANTSARRQWATASPYLIRGTPLSAHAGPVAEHLLPGPADRLRRRG